MGKILVVDDDPHIRELVRVFLRNEGFEVVEAGNGVETMSQIDTLAVHIEFTSAFYDQENDSGTWKMKGSLLNG